MTIKRTLTTAGVEKNTENHPLPEYPQLRPGISAIPAQGPDGQYYVGLKDEYDLSDEQLWLTEDLFYILQFFTGKYSCFEIRSFYMKKFGNFLFENRLTNLLEKLDEACLLDNERYNNRLVEISKSFKELPVRPAICAGTSYPDEPEALENTLQVFQNNLDKNNRIKLKNNRVKAVVAPHIDVRKGGPVFANVYSHIAASEPADLYVILGIGHQGLLNLFSITDKDFDTPFGTVKADAQLIKMLNDRSEIDFTLDEIAHRDEHSIEFQTIFLQYHCLDFKILPVLCSFPYTMWKEKKSRDHQVFKTFTQNLKSVLQDFKGSICYIASVDFSHVGIKYGDMKKPDNSFIANVERYDRDLLEAVAALDQERFQKLILANNDQYHVCGYSALTTLMEILSNANGHLLDYQTAVMDDMRSTVTFAGMVFD